MKRFIYIFALLSCTVSHGQDIAQILYIKSVNGNSLDFIETTNRTYDGGIVVAIGTTSDNIYTTCAPSGTKYIFRKYNKQGTAIEWEKCSPSAYFDRLFPTPDNHFIFMGAKSSTGGIGSRQFVAQKQKADGSVDWYNFYGGTSTEFLRDVIATNDNGYIFFGETYSNDGDIPQHPSWNTFNPNLVLLKIDTSGKRLWSKVYGGSQEDKAVGIAHGPNNGFYILATTWSNDYECNCLKTTNSANAFLARLDSNGDILWKRCLSGSTAGSGQAIVSDNNGGVYLGLRSSGGGLDVKNHLGGSDYWLVHIDSGNNILWSNSFGTIDNQEFINDICLSKDGSIWVAGTSQNVGEDVYTTYGGVSDAWLINVNGNGKLVKTLVLGSDGEDIIHTIQPLDNGGLIAGGTYNSPGKNNSEFPHIWGGGYTDAFIAFVSPWTTSINNTQGNSRLAKIHPNPVRNILTLESQKNISFKIYNYIGNEIYKGSINEIYKVDMSSCDPGIYLIEFNDHRGNRFVEKIMKL